MNIILKTIKIEKAKEDLAFFKDSLESLKKQIDENPSHLIDWDFARKRNIYLCGEIRKIEEEIAALQAA